jgi:hypothetical protein
MAKPQRTSSDNNSDHFKYDALALTYAALGVTGIDHSISPLESFAGRGT